MNFSNFLNFGKKAEKRNLNNSINYSCGCNDGLLFGALTNDASALNISAFFRCVNIISQTIASMPFYVKDKENKEVFDHPISLVFRDKQDNVISMFDAIKMVIQNVLLTGNGYLLIERSGGIATNLRYLMANDVLINYKKETNKVYYQCSYINHGSAINSHDILHFKMHSYNGVNGISLVQYATRSINIANQAENMAKSYFSKGGMLNGILKVNSNLSEQQRIQIQNAWNNTYRIGDGGGVALLQGNMDYQNIAVNAADAQMLESRKFSVEDIARFFGIPIQLLTGVGNYSLEQLQQVFLTNCIEPYIVMFEKEMNRKLFNEDEEYTVDIDEESILRCDKASQSTFYSTLVDKGIISRNEAREALHYNKVEGADDLIIPYSDIQQNTINNDKTTKKE